MKENIYTIPMMDAVKVNGECPFCFLENELEQHALNFVLGPGASYMESDIREQTDKAGFCRTHHKKMYDYGNRLGNGLILKTHLKSLNQEMKKEIASFHPTKSGFRLPGRKKETLPTQSKTNIGKWAASKSKSCYICDYMDQTMVRYVKTFFELFAQNLEFRNLIQNSKGFCIPHFGILVEEAGNCLNATSQSQFYEMLFPLMETNLDRVCEDIEWFCDKFDYRYKDADWKNSKDAIPRSMQKAAGLYPQDDTPVKK